MTKTTTTMTMTTTTTNDNDNTSLAWVSLIMSLSEITIVTHGLIVSESRSLLLPPPLVVSPSYPLLSPTNAPDAAVEPTPVVSCLYLWNSYHAPPSAAAATANNNNNNNETIYHDNNDTNSNMGKYVQETRTFRSSRTVTVYYPDDKKQTQNLRPELQQQQ